MFLYKSIPLRVNLCSTDFSDILIFTFFSEKAYCIYAVGLFSL